MSCDTLLENQEAQLCERRGDSASALRNVSSPWQRIGIVLNPLWIGGVAVLCVLLSTVIASAVTPVIARAGAWLPYLALATLFPLAIAGGALWQRAGGKIPLPLTTSLIAISVLAGAVAAGPTATLIAIGLAQVQTVVCVLIAFRHEPIVPERVIALFVMAFIAWAVAIELYTWEPMQSALPVTWTVLMIGALALAASCWWAFSSARAALSLQRVADGIAILFLILLSFRTDGLFTTHRLGEFGTFYHWGAMVAPAEMVRQGGWLLWDVPSPYGFLTTLSLAALPTASSWQSLYLLNAIMTAALAIWLFCAVRALKPGIVNSLLALAVSAAVVLLIASYPQTLAPEHYFPMAGAFRYGWTYVLVGVLALERSSAPGSRGQRAILLVGCLCWLVSFLWSAESAFYGSAVWLPAFAFIMLRDHGGFAPQRRREWRTLIGWLLVPPVLLIVAVGTLFLIYQASLGHWPDLMAYVDSVLSFTGQSILEAQGSMEEVGYTGTVAPLFLGIVLFAMAAVSMARTNQGGNDLPLAIGFGFGLWGLMNYPIGSRFLYASFRMMPFLILGIAMLLAVLAPRYRGQADRRWIDFLKAGVIPLITILMTLTYANIPELSYYVHAMRTEPFLARDVTAGLPYVEPSLEELLQAAAVGANDPILYAGANQGDMMPVWTPAGSDIPVTVSRQWLAGPPSIMAFRPDDRKQAFVQRSAEQRPGGGWLIERLDRKDLDITVDSWFFEEVNKTYIPLKAAANESWQIVRYEPLAGLDGDFAPLPDAVRPALPPDFYVNGQAQMATVFPEVWGFYGSEWTPLTPGVDWRCADGDGTLWVLTPDATEARLILGVPGDNFGGQLAVTINDRSTSTEVTRTGKLSTAMSLVRGWNRITVALTTPDPTMLAAANTTEGCQQEKGASAPLQMNYVEVRIRG